MASDTDAKWYGWQVVWMRSGMDGKWYGCEVAWIPISTDGKLYGCQVVRMRSDMDCKRYGYQIEWYGDQVIRMIRLTDQISNGTISEWDTGEPCCHYTKPTLNPVKAIILSSTCQQRNCTTLLSLSASQPSTHKAISSCAARGLVVVRLAMSCQI